MSRRISWHCISSFAESDTDENSESDRPSDSEQFSKEYRKRDNVTDSHVRLRDNALAETVKCDLVKNSRDGRLVSKNNNTNPIQARHQSFGGLSDYVNSCEINPLLSGQSQPSSPSSSESGVVSGASDGELEGQGVTRGETKHRSLGYNLRRKTVFMSEELYSGKKYLLYV